MSLRGQASSEYKVGHNNLTDMKEGFDNNVSSVQLAKGLEHQTSFCSGKVLSTGSYQEQGFLTSVKPVLSRHPKDAQNAVA